MREELTKFERYQKQFRFLYDNDIETTEQLILFKEDSENKTDELTMQRNRLYGKANSKGEISEINIKLQALRKNMRMCDNIINDVEVIKEHQKYDENLEEEVKTIHYNKGR